MKAVKERKSIFTEIKNADADVQKLFKLIMSVSEAWSIIEDAQVYSTMHLDHDEVLREVVFAYVDREAVVRFLELQKQSDDIVLFTMKEYDRNVHYRE